MSIPRDENNIIPVDTLVVFKGYSEVPEGEEEILTADQVLRITSYSAENDCYAVVAVDDDTVVDTVFEEEISEHVAEEEVEEAPKATRKTRTKAKPAATAKPKAETKTETKAKPAAKATAKAKAAEKAETKAPAKAKAKPAEKEAALVVIGDIKDMVTSHEQALQSAAELAEAIAERTEALEQSKFSLGGVLCYIKAENVFEEEGFESIEAYCVERLKLRDRSCQTYMQVYTSLTSAGVTEKEIEGIGISKLRTIASVVDKSNKRNLIAKARKTSRDDLVEHVKEIRKGKASVTDPEAAKFKKLPALKLFVDQAETVEAGLEEAMKVYSTESMAEALHYVMTDWMASQEAEVPLADALEALNARYGTDYELPDE